MEQEIAGGNDDVSDNKMMGVGEPFKVHPKRKACYNKVKNILELDVDRGVDMIEANGTKNEG